MTVLLAMGGAAGAEAGAGQPCGEVAGSSGGMAAGAAGGGSLLPNNLLRRPNMGVGRRLACPRFFVDNKAATKQEDCQIK
jgi:hypothetical protein